MKAKAAQAAAAVHQLEKEVVVKQEEVTPTIPRIVSEAHEPTPG